MQITATTPFRKIVGIAITGMLVIEDFVMAAGRQEKRRGNAKFI
jgi:hypothetical protein